MEGLRLTDEIRSLILDHRWAELENALSVLPAPEIGELLRELDPSARCVVFRLLSRHHADEVFSYLEPEDEIALLDDLTDDETRRLVAGLRPDDRTLLLEDMPGQAVQRLLNMLPPDDLEETRRLLNYPDESVGRLMTPEYVAVRPQWTVAGALDHIRRFGQDHESLSVVYVVDPHWRLLDAVNLERFVLADRDAPVESIMDRRFTAVSAHDDREVAASIMRRYDLYALPVVDDDGALLGVVTVDDALQVAADEATEDFHKTAAVSPLKIGYQGSSVWALYRKRIPWLVVLVGISLLSSGVIAAFEATLAAVVALAFFIPLLIGSGGNTGAQSATLMVRALATGDVTPGLWFRVFLKEIAVGLALGATMAVASGILGIFRGGWEIGVVVGLAMAGIVLVANLIGVLLPFILTRLRLDPAVASSPLITTIADACGLLIYFSLATWLLLPLE